MKAHLFAAAAMILCLLSCNTAEKSDPLALKREHMFSEGPLYSFPMSVLEISCDDYDKGDCTEEKIVCCAKDFWGYTNVRIVSEETFNNRIFKLYSIGKPIVVSSEVYESLSGDRIIADEELSEVYEQQGIGGILRILSSKDLLLWERDDYEKFKYIISLCWEHDIFFTEHLNDEYPLASWSISGDKELINKYYRNDGTGKEQVIEAASNESYGRGPIYWAIYDFSGTFGRLPENAAEVNEFIKKNSRHGTYYRYGDHLRKSQYVFMGDSCFFIHKVKGYEERGVFYDDPLPPSNYTDKIVSEENFVCNKAFVPRRKPEFIIENARGKSGVEGPLYHAIHSFIETYYRLPLNAKEINDFIIFISRYSPGASFRLGDWISDKEFVNMTDSCFFLTRYGLSKDCGVYYSPSFLLNHLELLADPPGESWYLYFSPCFYNGKGERCYLAQEDEDEFAEMIKGITRKYDRCMQKQRVLSSRYQLMFLLSYENGEVSIFGDIPPSDSLFVYNISEKVSEPGGEPYLDEIEDGIKEFCAIHPEVKKIIFPSRLPVIRH